MPAYGTRAASFAADNHQRERSYRIAGALKITHFASMSNRIYRLRWLEHPGTPCKRFYNITDLSPIPREAGIHRSSCGPAGVVEATVGYCHMDLKRRSVVAIFPGSEILQDRSDCWSNRGDQASPDRDRYGFE